MKFLAPILQGIIILLIVSLFGGGVKVYAEFEQVKTRVQLLEQSINRFERKLAEVPLCRAH
jgi:Tfp pilus assembly protein PilN